MESEPLTLEEHTAQERRAGRRFLFVGLAIIALGCLAIGWWNWSAAREWRQLKAELEAKGEIFDFHALLPPAPPEAENFGAIAALKDLALVVDGDDDKGEPAERRRAFISPDAASRTMHTPPERPTRSSGPQSGRAAEMAPWAEYFRKTGGLKLPPDSGNAAADLLAGIDGTVPVIKELAASSMLPAAQFTPSFAEREWPKILVATPVPHMQPTQNAANLLRLRAVAAAHAKDGQTAMESILAMSKLAEAMGQEPSLLPHLVSITIRSLMHASLWEGVRLRVFSAEQLARLQDSLACYDGRATLLYAMQTEKLAGIDYIQQLKRDHTKTNETLGVDLLSKFLGYMPSGWFDQNLTRIVRFEHQYIIDPLKKENFLAAALKSEAMNKHLEAMMKPTLAKLANGLTFLTLPSFAIVVGKSAYAQSTNDLALTAVALERYYLHHQKYPSALRDLAPALLPAPPASSLDGTPLGYRPTPDGRYMIWSFGFDGVDDGGKGSVNVFGVTVPGLTRAYYKGDWVWQYTPIQK